ncbi:MAG: cupredoxin domain-containing protein [Pseudonocardiaceae bacterium]
MLIAVPPIGRRHRIAAALVAVAVVLSLTACGTSSRTKIPRPVPAALVYPAITVVIKNFAFLPAKFTVRPGATVAVLNQDAALHTVTADNREFNTGNVARGQTTTFQAPTQPGKYPYHSLLQPYMTGVLTVS